MGQHCHRRVDVRRRRHQGQSVPLREPGRPSARRVERKDGLAASAKVCGGCWRSAASRLMTSEGPARKCAGLRGASWSRSNCCSATRQVQTTEGYLGTKQDLVHAPNDGIKLKVAV